MTTDQITKLATEKGYTFSNAIKSGSSWTTFILLSDGPAISFCGNVLSSVTRTDKSNLHEFVHLMERWKQALGAPDETAASQDHSSGLPVSRLEYKWTRQENLKQDISFSQFGINDLQLSYSYSYDRLLDKQLRWLSIDSGRITSLNVAVRSRLSCA